jgi:NTP pyrophosphatase (non-canonical NTP hydrolase)
VNEQKLSFDRLRRANLERCVGSFHPLHEWSLTDWTTAAAGEMGEAANVVKKIRRLQAPDGTIAPLDVRQVALLIDDLTGEIADAVIYLDLLAARAGIDLGEAVRGKFNVVSERVDSEVRL